MKIKEICRKTGLTEKAVRYYVENGLCEPEEYECRDRKYLNFTEENVAELRDVAVLRRLGFPIDDIRKMKNNGSEIGGVMNGYLRSLSEELEIKNRIYSRLSSEDYSRVNSLDELMPSLSGILKPDPADPDFSKFENGLFDDGVAPGEQAREPGGFTKVKEMFVNCTTLIGTLMALGTLPGIVMLAVAVAVLLKVRADYMTMFRILSGISCLSNAIAFVRSLIDILGGEGLAAGYGPDFAMMQCRLYLLAAAGGLAALLILIFDKDIRERF